MQQIYEERSDKGLILLVINIGESSAKVEEFMRHYNLFPPVLLDVEGVLVQRYNITAFPITFFIDKNGIIQEKIIGAFPSKEVIESYLSQIIP